MKPYNLVEFGDFFTHKRVLVTGATGFIGFHLCKLLMDLNAEVFGSAIDGNLHQEIQQLPLTILDLRNPDELERYISTTEPEFVFHLAGLVNTSRDIGLVYPTLQHNLISTINLMSFAREKPIKRSSLCLHLRRPQGAESRFALFGVQRSCYFLRKNICRV